MTPGIIRSLKTQVPALAIAVVALAHTAVNALAGQEPLRDRAITHGYGLSNVTVLGQVVPARGGNPLPSGVWVILRGVFGHEQRQLVEGDRRFYFANVPRAKLVLIVEADGHHPARFDINPNDGDTYLEVTPGPPLRVSTKHLPSAPLTVDARSLKIPAKAVRELKAAGKYIQEGELDKALRRLQKSTQLYPAYDSAYNDMGVVYLKMGRYEEAGTAFSKAVEINPNFDVTQANLGLYYLVTGQREQAVEHLSRAVAFDPKAENAGLPCRSTLRDGTMLRGGAAAKTAHLHRPSVLFRLPEAGVRVSRAETLQRSAGNVPSVHEQPAGRECYRNQRADVSVGEKIQVETAHG